MIMRRKRMGRMPPERAATAPVISRAASETSTEAASTPVS
jgi:hypothetical protein